MPLVIAVVVGAVLWLLFKGTGAASPSASASAGRSNPGPGDTTGYGDALDNLMQGIFQYEGGQPGNINVRNNNPGNLRAGPGMTGTASGYATFGDQGDGWDALATWVNSHAAAHPDWDFYNMTDYYLRGSTTAPSVDNQGNSDAYAEYLANYLGVSPTQTVSSVLNGGSDGDQG